LSAKLVLEGLLDYFRLVDLEEVSLMAKIKVIAVLEEY